MTLVEWIGKLRTRSAIGEATAGAGIEEDAAAAAFEERDAPAVGMLVGAAAALAKAGERETDVGRDVAVHPQQLAHRTVLKVKAARWRRRSRRLQGC